MKWEDELPLCAATIACCLDAAISCWPLVMLVAAHCAVIDSKTKEICKRVNSE
jgi:hypothetical protein